MMNMSIKESIHSRNSAVLPVACYRSTNGVNKNRTGTCSILITLLCWNIHQDIAAY
jgi:hypothetical protein